MTTEASQFMGAAEKRPLESNQDPFLSLIQQTCGLFKNRLAQMHGCRFSGRPGLFPTIP